MSLPTSASQPLSYNVDVLASIAEHLPWPTLVHFLKFPKDAPTVVRPETKHRIHDRIARFLATIDVDMFFGMLEICEAVIVGLFVREIMLSEKEGPGAMLRQTQSLDILGERHQEDGIRALLEANDFRPGMVNVRNEHKDCIYMVEDYVHKDDHTKVRAEADLFV
jgi:hypothetical protein